ncbi:MAG: hypothetical protein IJW86_00220 [Clostridia bacterium]|nr:hypothetical protein [Clostridia bacterium]
MLRRLLCALPIIGLMFCLCACNGVKVPYQPRQFTADVIFQSAGTIIKGELTYNSPEDMSLKIKEPDNIEGLEFKSAKSGVSIGAGDVSFSAQKPEESPVYNLFALLENFAKSDISISLSGEDEIILQHSGKEYRVKIDCEEKKIISIETENYHYKFE